MDAIVMQGTETTVTVDPNDKFLAGEKVLLGFRRNGDTSRTVVALVEKDLDMVIHAITKYRQTQALERLRRVKEESK